MAVWIFCSFNTHTHSHLQLCVGFIVFLCVEIFCDFFFSLKLASLESWHPIVTNVIQH